MAEKKGFYKEFKTFVMRGNVIDMAVGIAIGGAFNTIVNSIVNDIINPITGFIVGNVNFKDLKIVLKPATEETAEVAVKYGNVIQNIFSFLITAFVLFLVIKGMNRLHDELDAQEARLAKTVEKIIPKKKAEK